MDCLNFAPLLEAGTWSCRWPRGRRTSNPISSLETMPGWRQGTPGHRSLLVVQSPQKFRSKGDFGDRSPAEGRSRMSPSESRKNAVVEKNAVGRRACPGGDGGVRVACVGCTRAHGAEPRCAARLPIPLAAPAPGSTKRTRGRVKRTYQPHTRRRARNHGFRHRMSTRAGRAIIRARRQKGRRRLSA